MNKFELELKLERMDRYIHNLDERISSTIKELISIENECDIFKKCLINVFNSTFNIDLNKKIYEITLSAKDKKSSDIKDYFIANDIKEVYNYLIVSPDYEIKNIVVYKECNQ